jgi:hypothetical protein
MTARPAINLKIGFPFAAHDGTSATTTGDVRQNTPAADSGRLEAI